MALSIDLSRLTRMTACAALAIVLFSFSSCAKKAAPSRAATPSSSVTELPSTAPSGPNNMETGILYYVNLHRRSMGLPLLQMNRTESSIAAQHSRDMARGKVPFGHMHFQSRVDLIKKELGPVMATAENVAYGQRSPREVVADWLQSAGHRANIEGNFKLTGIGLARDAKGLIYYTQIFTR